MNDEEKQLLRAQQEMYNWAKIRHWISEGLCIGCGGEPSVKLYVHFCDQCLYEAGVQIVFLDPPETIIGPKADHPPPSIDDIGAEWLLFIKNLHKLKDKRAE